MAKTVDVRRESFDTLDHCGSSGRLFATMPQEP